VEANNFRRMVLELDRRFPGLGRQIEESMAVAIDGEIFQDPTSLRSTGLRDLPDPQKAAAEAWQDERLRWLSC
jgi:hypothetical protein